MRQVDSVFFAASSTSDNSSKEEDRAFPEDTTIEEDEYDDSWDYIYDDNDFENRRRKINRSEKYRYKKQDW